MKKHVDSEHGALLKRYVEEVNNCFKPSFQHELAIKRLHVTPIAIFRFFSSINQFTKYHETQIAFLEDERLYVIKGFLPMRIVESIWLH
jgi:hypothetical protein